MIWSLRFGQRCLVASLLGLSICASALDSGAGAQKVLAPSKISLRPKRELVLFRDGEEDPLKDVDRNATYPEWTWNHTRAWVAIRRADAYSDEQIHALASHDVVMLEKANGAKTYGNVERGTLEAAMRIKAVNPNVTVLFYLNSMVHYGGYEANAEFDKNREQWSKKRSNGSYFKWRGKFLAYDHNNPDLREWWIQRALEMVSHDEIDGIFIDGICKVGRADLSGYLITANTLRSRLPPGKLLVGNALRANEGKDSNLSHLKYLDGSYLENWAEPKRLEETLELMSIALKHNRIIMLSAYPAHLNQRQFNRIKSLDERYELLAEPEHINFPLGYFLLTAEPHSYFSYRSHVDANPRRKNVWDNSRFDAIMRRLGEPMGDMVKEEDGQYSREFEYIKVYVDIKAQAAVLTVKKDGDDEEDDFSE